MKEKKRISLTCGPKHKRVVRRKFTPRPIKCYSIKNKNSVDTITQPHCSHSQSSPIVHPQSSPIPHSPFIGIEYLLGFTPLNKIRQSVLVVLKYKMYLMVRNTACLVPNINMHYFGSTLSTVYENTGVKLSNKDLGKLLNEALDTYNHYSMASEQKKLFEEARS